MVTNSKSSGCQINFENNQSERIYKTNEELLRHGDFFIWAPKSHIPGLSQTTDDIYQTILGQD